MRCFRTPNCCFILLLSATRSSSGFGGKEEREGGGGVGRSKVGMIDGERGNTHTDRQTDSRMTRET
jgi:hypothetical protein